MMREFRKDGYCNCGHPDEWKANDKIPISYSEEFNEYKLTCEGGHNLIMYYCPFCGGKLPGSLRSQDFSEHDKSEEDEVKSLTGKIETVEKIYNVLGEPDKTIDCGDFEEKFFFVLKASWIETYSSPTLPKLMISKHRVYTLYNTGTTSLGRSPETCFEFTFSPRAVSSEAEEAFFNTSWKTMATFSNSEMSRSLIISATKNSSASVAYEIRYMPDDMQPPELPHYIVQDIESGQIGVQKMRYCWVRKMSLPTSQIDPFRQGSQYIILIL